MIIRAIKNKQFLALKKKPQRNTNSLETVILFPRQYYGMFDDILSIHDNVYETKPYRCIYNLLFCVT